MSAEPRRRAPSPEPICSQCRTLAHDGPCDPGDLFEGADTQEIPRLTDADLLPLRGVLR